VGFPSNEDTTMAYGVNGLEKARFPQNQFNFNQTAGPTKFYAP